MFIKHHFDVLQLLMIPANGLYYRIFKDEITLDCVKPEPGKFTFKLGNNEMSLGAGALTLSCLIGTFVDFTLSNARRFYSSMGNPLGRKGLTTTLSKNVPIFKSNHKELSAELKVVSKPVWWLPTDCYCFNVKHLIWRKLIWLNCKWNLYFRK